MKYMIEWGTNYYFNGMQLEDKQLWNLTASKQEAYRCYLKFARHLIRDHKKFTGNSIRRYNIRCYNNVF